jgi:hypothetical protein
MHLDGKSTGSGLALPLTAGALAKAGEVLLADGHIACGVAGAGVVHQDLEVHLSFAAETLDIGLEMTLIGADGAAQGVVVLKGGAKPEGQDSGEFEAVCDNASVVFGGLLIKLFAVFGGVLGDDDGEITGWEEECLMTEDTRNSGKGHWTAMPGKFREGLTFCDAIGVPCHDFLPSFMR